MTQTTFHTPSTLLFGAGCRGQLAGELRRMRARRVLLVTDPYLLQSGVIDNLLPQLESDDIRATVFSNVQPDPTVQNVLDGVRSLREAGAEAIVAVGGGSAIDAAKVISAAHRHSGPLRDLQGYHRVPAGGPPVVAVPTTAGTGSEATKVAVITDSERRVKMMMLDPKLMPAAAIIDYELTVTMPAALTAYVGVDTLTHGIEAYVSTRANGMSDPLALSCVQLTARHLVNAWREPRNTAARAGMSLAACQGGMAFTNSSVCLVHGMSRPLGALFHLPHGLSNAVLLPAVSRFSLRGAPQRYAQIARLMGVAGENQDDDSAWLALVGGLEQLNRQLEVPRLRDCVEAGKGAFEAALEKMAEDALASGSPQNNPVVPTAVEIAELYRESW